MHDPPSDRAALAIFVPLSVPLLPPRSATGYCALGRSTISTSSAVERPTEKHGAHPGEPLRSVGGQQAHGSGTLDGGGELASHQRVGQRVRRGRRRIDDRSRGGPSTPGTAPAPARKVRAPEHQRIGV